jgi:DNA polymerase-3 subunit delta'
MPWQTIGHASAVDLFQRSLASDHVSHAYLLSGPAGVGKRTLALELAQSLLCSVENSDERPCQSCPSCTRILHGSHPDLNIVELDTEHVQISRAAIGRLQSDAVLRPLLGPRKVYVLVDVELLSVVAANQLLKLLEEPPRGVTLILTTSAVGGVLPTILSRCQHVRLSRVPEATIVEHLLKHSDIDDDLAQRIARHAEGKLGWATQCAADPTILERYDLAVSELHVLLGDGRLRRLIKAQSLAAQWASNRAETLEYLAIWARVFRDIAVVGATGAASIEAESAAISVSQRMNTIAAVKGARAVQHTAELLEQNVNARLALDNLVMDLPEIAQR